MMVNALFNIEPVVDREQGPGGRGQADPPEASAAPKCARSSYVRAYYRAWYATKALGLPSPPRLPWDEATLKHYTELVAGQR